MAWTDLTVDATGAHMWDSTTAAVDVSWCGGGPDSWVLYQFIEHLLESNVFSVPENDRHSLTNALMQ